MVVYGTVALLSLLQNIVLGHLTAFYEVYVPVKIYLHFIIWH